MNSFTYTYAVIREIMEAMKLYFMQLDF